MKKLLLLLLPALLFSCTNKSSKISGAGATFPAPFYNIVFKNFNSKTGTQVSYGAIGSGGGIRSLEDRTAEFGASDIYLSDVELASFNNQVVHIPTALGAVVLAYTLPEVKELNLNAEVVSKIYRGEITKWNDAAIQELNAGQTFPNKAITPIYRSDGSGTTFVFSDYMCKADALWEKNIGKNKSLNFPVGIAAKGNPGVAGIIAETDGSIGYIGSEYALTLDIASAKMQNSSGNFIAANMSSIAAAADIAMPEDTRIMISNSPNEQAYPISTFTWIIVYKEQNYNGRTKEQAENLVNLLDFMTGPEGQDVAVQTHYAPLKGNALEQTKKAVKSITYDGQPLLK